VNLIQHLFTRKQRLTKKSDFASMYASASKRTVGPLLIHKKQNTLGYSRLGLSIPKRVGTATKRNSIKRLCREAFRLSQFDIPTGIDVLITIRPHEPKTLTEYIELIHLGTRK